MILKDLRNSLEYTHKFNFSVIRYDESKDPLGLIDEPFYADHFCLVKSNSSSLDQFDDFEVIRLRVYERDILTFDLLEVE